MNLYSFEGKTPQVHPEAFVAPTATLVGDVVVEKGASIWYGAVLRADDCRIVVHEGANVQDNSVLHAAPGKTLEIGAGATIAHACVIHGDAVGERALIANGTVMLDDTSVGAGSLVAAGSVITPGTAIPPGVLASGIPARVQKPIEGSSSSVWIELNPPYYQDLGRRHREGIAPVTGTAPGGE